MARRESVEEMSRMALMQEVTRLRAEVTPLRAVARAAEHLVNEDRNRPPGTICWSWIEACDRTQRALARLRRAEGGKP